MKESQLQQQVVYYLKLKGHLCFSVPNGFWNGIKNKIKKMAYINKLKKEGLLNGVADLIVLQPNKKTTFLELKVGYNKQSKYQKLFEKEVKDRGFSYHIIKSLDDVVALGF